MENINVNLSNLTQDEREQLMKLIKKSNKVKSRVWKPKCDEKYYFITSIGVSDFHWDNDGDELDQHLYSIGNCYPTKEAAEFALERMKVLTELQRYVDEYNDGKIDWSDFGQTKYSIYYDHEDCEFCVTKNSYVQQSLIYFTSEENALEAIETIGVDRIKKYMFGIED